VAGRNSVPRRSLQARVRSVRAALRLLRPSGDRWRICTCTARPRCKARPNGEPRNPPAWMRDRRAPRHFASRDPLGAGSQADDSRCRSAGADRGPPPGARDRANGRRLSAGADGALEIGAVPRPGGAPPAADRRSSRPRGWPAVLAGVYQRMLWSTRKRPSQEGDPGPAFSARQIRPPSPRRRSCGRAGPRVLAHDLGRALAVIGLRVSRRPQPGARGRCTRACAAARRHGTASRERVLHDAVSPDVVITVAIAPPAPSVARSAGQRESTLPRAPVHDDPSAWNACAKSDGPDRARGAPSPPEKKKIAVF